MNNPIKLNDTLYGVVVPKECDDYEILRSQDNFNLRQLHYQSDFWNGLPNYDRINLGESDFELLGEVMADSISKELKDFLKYEYSWCEDEFRSLLQSNGIYFENPIEKPNVNDDYWRDANGFTDEYMDEISRWQEAESKLVEKVVIIKKV